MRKKIVAGNWKMNKQMEEGLKLTFAIKETNKNFPEELEVVLAPPFIHLYAMEELLKNQPNFFLGAQNCHEEESGAYTGEVSAAMLASVGVDYVIIGHSERRHYFNETDTHVANKLQQAIANDLNPILCVGEHLAIRNDKKHFEYVQQQIENTLFSFTADLMQDLVIAYEPVWAIGTGHNATPEQAQEMHQHIRQILQDQYSKSFANNLTILYGGSCKPSNAPDLFQQPDIDGGLIGGASLSADDFSAIIQSF
ncbi:MAG: triose-phosphate isomerase [Bacteroidetes bacterium SW_11_45_7]|nr:MAG: triose-phosphate isomerase [Bacteroidetes bacterium SW_11_45_7]